MGAARSGESMRPEADGVRAKKDLPTGGGGAALAGSRWRDAPEVWSLLAELVCQGSLAWEDTDAD